MDVTLSDGEMLALVRQVRADSEVVDREVLQSTRLSRVERVIIDDGTTYIAKRGTHLLVDEVDTIRSLHGSPIPIAELYVADIKGESLTMLMEDLGPVKIQPTIEDAAEMAVRMTQTTPPDHLPTEGRESLERQPQNIKSGIEQLVSLGTWENPDRIRRPLDDIVKAASDLSSGTELRPFGLCHREYHPTSLHIGTKKTALVDWQRTYVGPLLPCLVNWFPIADAPNLKACRRLIKAYISEGGDPEAQEKRGDLRPESWAFFWQRVGAAEWWINSQINWQTNDTQDGSWQRAVERAIVDAQWLLP
jgi:hypothetical protein